MRFPMGVSEMNSRFLSKPLKAISFSAALLMILLAGCVISPRRDGTTTTPGTTPGTGQGKLYVTNDTTNAILRFDGALTTTGNVSPATIITSSQIAAPQYLVVETV